MWCIGSLMYRLRSFVSCWCLEKNTQYSNILISTTVPREAGNQEMPTYWIFNGTEGAGTIPCGAVSVFQRFPETAHSPECFPLFAEVQWCQAAVVLLVEHPAPCSLQQSPAHLHPAPLCCDVERRRPLLVDCIQGTALTHKHKVEVVSR